MKLIVGLGNPGENYKKSRHNTGFMVVDNLATILGAENWKLDKKNKSMVTNSKGLVVLIKPQTFMNESGKGVRKVLDFYKADIANLWVIHDDLDIKLGEFKIQRGKGPRLHNGVNSIEKELGKEGFWRVRVGVDNREVGNRIPGEEYVLQRFTDKELEVIKRITEEVSRELIGHVPH